MVYFSWVVVLCCLKFITPPKLNKQLNENYMTTNIWDEIFTKIHIVKNQHLYYFKDLVYLYKTDYTTQVN